MTATERADLEAEGQALADELDQIVLSVKDPNVPDEVAWGLMQDGNRKSERLQQITALLKG